MVRSAMIRRRQFLGTALAAGALLPAVSLTGCARGRGNWGHDVRLQPYSSRTGNIMIKYMFY